MRETKNDEWVVWALIAPPSAVVYIPGRRDLPSSAMPPGSYIYDEGPFESEKEVKRWAHFYNMQKAVDEIRPGEQEGKKA